MVTKHRADTKYKIAKLYNLIRTKYKVPANILLDFRDAVKEYNLQ